MTRATTILMADDDEDDRFLVLTAWRAARLRNDLRFVKDGVELLQYLRRQGEYAPPTSSPPPGLVLLDLNMPRMDGREALKQIKEDPVLRSIPVVVFTTSRADIDLARSYAAGANSYITKPVTFERLVEVLREVVRYWFEVVDLPPPDR